MDSIFSYLTEDHKACDRLLLDAGNSVASGDWEQAAAAFRRYSEKFNRHMAIEEVVLFPMLMRLAESETGPVQTLRTEHARIRVLLQRIGDAIDGRRKKDVFLHFESLTLFMQAHSQKEESIVYPVLERRFPLNTKEALMTMPD